VRGTDKEGSSLCEVQVSSNQNDVIVAETSEIPRESGGIEEVREEPCHSLRTPLSFPAHKNMFSYREGRGKKELS